MPRTRTSTWTFQKHFRRNAFGWRNGPPRTRLREAVSEIRKVARKDPVTAAEGAVRLIERLPAAIEHTDDSSGALGNAIHRMLEFAGELIGTVEVDEPTRERWLERLWAAHEADEMPWIEGLGELWGTVCGNAQMASEWADRLTPAPRRVSTDPFDYQPYDRRTVPWLSAMFRAGRFDEIVAALEADQVWPHARWAVAALREKGARAAALRRAEAARGAYGGELEIARICETLLLESGLREEAWKRYALTAHESGSRVTWLKSLLECYPERKPESVLEALVTTTPGQEGRWFAAARQAGLLDAALQIAERSAAEPATLITAVKQHAGTDPRFALDCGLLAVRGVLRGDAFDPVKIDLHTLADGLARAADALDAGDEMRSGVRALLEAHLATADPLWIRRFEALQRTTLA